MLLVALRWLERATWWASVWRLDRLPSDLATFRTVARWCRASWTLWRRTSQRMTLKLSEAYHDESL
jgi:hypothetical protein